MRFHWAVVFVAGAAVLAAPNVRGEGLSVTARPVSEVAVVERQRAPGEVVPAHRTVLASQLAARIASVEVDVGMRVRRGDTLVTLEKRDFELALAQRAANIKSLQAQIDQARAQLARAESLIAKNFTSREDVQSRATALAVLEGQIAVERVARDVAKEDLARTRIVAPFNGDVVERAAQLGGFVNVASPLVTLSQSDAREVDVQAHPGAVAGLAAPGSQPVFAGYDRDFALRVARVSPVIDATTQLQTVRLKFAGDEAPVGATGSVSWRRASSLIPARLVEQRGGKLGVFTVDGNVARFVPLPAASEGRAADHQLAPDTLIIDKGRTRLADGDAISVVSP
ncbi:MAG: efflux RND transporter periplasmic adaptor subunit [Pseudomonadota bacterium]